MQRFRIFLLAGLICIAGCGYGKVSPTTYELAKALYNISNRKVSEKLVVAKQQIESAKEKNEITDQEAKWLKAILHRAEQGQWDKAMKSARRIMEDQVVN